jgi:hypothetical protein
MIGELFMFKKLLPLLFLFTGFQVNAAVIITSDDVYNDNGLEWLHFNFTRNKTAAASLSDYSGFGFRMASLAEASSLQEGWFGVEYSVNSLNEIVASDKAAEWLAEFGQTGCSGCSNVMLEGLGIFGVGQGGGQYPPMMFRSLGAVTGYSSGGADWAAGYFMVRGATVSEPSIIAIFALGLVGVGFARRRQS